MTATTPRESTHHAFEAEVSEVLRLVIHSLYSNREIFLRELISNASDALDKLRFEALTSPELLPPDTTLGIRLQANPDDNTLTISDNGIGMSREDLISHLGTIARSGSKAFLEAVREKAEAPQLIGQFGVGFYSSWLVANHVRVVSRAAGSDEAWAWESDGKSSFTVEPAVRETQGTTITLFLQDDQNEYTTPFRIRNLVSRYSDYVGHPIELEVEEPARKDDDGNEIEPARKVWQKVNEASALWQRTPSEVTEEQYAQFYQHLTSDWEKPLAQTHFRVEGTQVFAGLLFIPGRPPFDLFDPEASRGLRLYVRRVFIMEDAEELLPRWLRFVRGVLDSDDLPLNVSRELLQDSRLVQQLRKQITRKVLDLLESMATDRPDDYRKVWSLYGRVIKEGFFQDRSYAERLGSLLRVQTLKHEEPVSLQQLLNERAEGQSDLYYVMGPSRNVLQESPHLEALRRKGYDVILLTDAVDPWVMESLTTFKETTLRNVMDGDLDLGEGASDDAQETEKAQEEHEALCTRLQEALSDHVSSVRVSRRLEDSPACLLHGETGLPSHIERLLRANNQEIPSSRRVLEINPRHAVLVYLDALQKREDDANKGELDRWARLLHDQALLAEGSPLEDPARFARELQLLMTVAVQSDGLGPAPVKTTREAPSEAASATHENTAPSDEATAPGEEPSAVS